MAFEFVGYTAQSFFYTPFDSTSCKAKNITNAVIMALINAIEKRSTEKRGEGVTDSYDNEQEIHDKILIDRKAQKRIETQAVFRNIFDLLRERATTPKQVRIIDYVVDHPDATKEEIAQDAKCSLSYVEKYFAWIKSEVKRNQ